MSLARAHLALMLCLVLGACSSPVASPTPGSSATAGPTATPTPDPTATRAALLVWPTNSAVALAPGRYSSSPPFDIAFTFEILDTGWDSAHLHSEFFDFTNVTDPGAQPTRLVAFAHPEMIYGVEAVPAAGLSPHAAADLLADLGDVVAGPISDTALNGIVGVRVDLTAQVANTHLFGGPAGPFTLDPNYDLRLTLLPHDPTHDLLLVLVLAPRGEVDQAWMEVEPILSTVDF